MTDADLQSHNYYPPRLRITNREQLLRAAGLSRFLSKKHRLRKKKEPQHLQILLNPNQNPRIISSILSKNESVKRLIRESLCYPCFIF